VSVVTTGTYLVNFGDSIDASLSSIFGTVFDDANANSVFDVTEVGIPNVPIRIDGNFSGVPITSVTTNYLGQYTFLIDQFTPSNVFTVTETDLPGYVSTTPNVVAQAVAVNTGYTVSFGDLLAPVCAPDAYEALNDNLFSTTGVTLTTSGSPLHNFFSPNDEDWLRVTLKQGDIYTFTTVAFGARTDTVLALFAPDGVTRLAQSDDLPGSTDHSSQINWVGTANGTHYLRVTPLTLLPAPGCLTDYNVTMAVTPRYTLVFPLVARNLP